MRGLPPRADRLARLELDERIRDLRRRGHKPHAISKEVGVEIKVVTASLRRFEAECLKKAEEDVRAAAAAYRHVMIDNLERLKREAWDQIELAKETKKQTRQEMLKDSDGKVTHQRAKVDVLPGETAPALIGEIRQIEVALGRLHGVSVDEPPQPVAPLAVGGDLIVINPTEPPDLDRLRDLRERIELRQQKVIDVPAKVVGGNGSAS